MTDSPMTAREAIALSVAESRTVSLEYTAALGAALTLECDDCEEHPLATPRCDEYWGTDGDDTWRVHLYGPDAD